ncbi:hypothetical protein NL493_30250, partial [Klebsiella pneumoniae]|nr:hypothetical protein [Klebsiella pneumoniae]
SSGAYPHQNPTSAWLYTKSYDAKEGSFLFCFVLFPGGRRVVRAVMLYRRMAQSSTARTWKTATLLLR